MAEQNPWKKQMQQNKAQTTSESTPPISQFPPQDKITPPWMKNKQTNNTNPPANTQPAWMKNNTNTANENSTTPPWMKAKQTTNPPSQPGSISKPSEPTSTGPAWMQKKPADQQPASTNVPAWKAGGSAFGADKKKKEEEERLKREQEEKQRLEREEQERKKMEKLTEEEEERKAVQRMQEEDKLSKLREEHDLKVELQKKRQQEQRKRIEEQQKSAKKQKTSKGKSSTKQTATIRSPPGPSCPLYTHYLYHFSQSTNPSLEYKQKLSSQLSLLKTCHQYSHQMAQKVKQIAAESQQDEQKKILSATKKNKIANLDEIKTQLYYAFCEGQQREQRSEKSRVAKEQAQDQPSIRFDMSQIQKLENVFNFYNCLTNIIISFSKKQPTLITKFRTPLFTFLQYKGIAFLAESYTDELLEVQAILPFQHKEIISDFAVIQKELKEKYHYHLSKSDLLVKKLFVEDIQEEIYVIYLKNWDLKLSKHAQIHNQTTIEQLTTDYYFLSQSLGKKIPLIPQSEFDVFKKVKTQAFSELSDVVHLAQCIFVVYSSCQGEVEEKEFWELILSEGEEIWNLIRCAGYRGKLHKDKRFLFKIFELFSGVEIKFETKKSSKQQKMCVRESRCIKGVYDLTKMQFNEIIRNSDKYLKDNRYELVEHSLKMLKEIEDVTHQIKESPNEQSQQPTESQIVSLNYIFHQTKYLISKGQFRQAVKVLQKFLVQSQDSKNKSFQTIPIKMELLVLYIKLKKENEILKTFGELLQIVEFYFGGQSLINSTLYQMLGSYYALKGKDAQNFVQNHVITLYEHAISIVIKFYGDQSESIAEVYLSRAVAFLNLLNFDLFQKDIDHALKIFKSHSRKKDKIAECLFYKGRSKLLQNQAEAKSEGIQLIEQSSLIYLRLSHFSQATVGFLIVIEMLDEKVDQNMKKIEALSNQVIQTILNSFKSAIHLSKAINIILNKLDPQLKNLISDIEEKNANGEVKEFSLSEKEQNVQQKHRQVFCEFQEVMKGFSSFTELVKWLGYTALSLVKTQSSHSVSRQKFVEITELLSGIIKIDMMEKANQKNEQENEQNSEQQNDENYEQNEESKSDFSQLNKSVRSSSQLQQSPIGRIKHDLE